MKNRSRAAASLGLLALLVGGALWLRRTPEALPSRLPSAARCAFADAGELGFRLTVTPELGAVDAGAPGESTGLRATLRLRPLREAQGHSWLLAGRFEPAQGTPNPEDLRTPFLLRVGPTCEFMEFAWPPETTGRQAEAVRAALRTFEFRLPTEPSERWEVSHRDAAGVFLARYRQRAAPTLEAGLELEAEAGDYIQASSASTAHQLAWSLHAWLDPRGHLARRVEGAARYDLSASDGVSTRLALRFVLERAESPSGPAAAENDQGFSWGMPAQAPTVERAAPPPPDGPDPLASLSVDDAYARLLELFDADQDPAHDRAFRHLRAWLRARPGAAEELLERLRRGRVDARLHALVFMTLGEADTAETRRALIHALGEHTLAALDRQRAAAALGTARTATLESLEALRAMSREAGNREDDVLNRGVAMRSLGAMASDTAPPAVASEARDTIRAAVASSDPAEHLAGLDAAGNARSAALLPTIRDSLSDRTDSARESAVHALRGLPRDAAQPLLTERLRDEQTPAVRREVALTLTENAHGQFSPESIEAAAAALPLTPEASVRVELLRLLGEASRSMPRAKQVLLAWAVREPEPTLVQVLGHYLTAAELGEALRARAAANP